LIEALYAAERMQELAMDKEITDPNIRNIPTATPEEGIGVVEAPRGTLIHHYKSDKNGIMTEVNLIVATVNNAAAIGMSIDKAAKKLIKNGDVSDGALNMIEMAFRAYDPCFACATHLIADKSSFVVNVCNEKGDIIKTLKR
jgi:F420-non-reducing hydrogenase large subunit